MNNTFNEYLLGLTPKGQNIAREAVEVYLKGIIEDKSTIKSSHDIYSQCKDMATLNVEHFELLMMNRAFRLIKRVNISSGGLDRVAVDVRIIMKHCVMNDATVIACVHNHPSGNVLPSTDDKKVTEIIGEACKIFDIHFLDHVIVGDCNYHSFHDNDEL